MSDSFFKIGRGISLTPQSAVPSNPVNGDMYYDSTLNKFRKYQAGAWSDFDSGGGGSANYQISNVSPISFTDTSAAYVNVTNLEVTITTTGRPVFLTLMGNVTGTGDNSSSLEAKANAFSGPALPLANFRFTRDGTALNSAVSLGGVLAGSGSSPNGTSVRIPPGVMNFLDVVPAGTYTYRFQAYCGPSAAYAVTVRRCRLVAFEI